jgi:hypothetical protein
MNVRDTSMMESNMDKTPARYAIALIGGTIFGGAVLAVCLYSVKTQGSRLGGFR